jgi:predicted RNA-binding protein with RPS1 domain
MLDAPSFEGDRMRAGRWACGFFRTRRANRARQTRRTFPFTACRSKGAWLVTNITDFGVFVDLGGVEGLVHISELSWGRVTHPSQFVKLGSTIDVQVLDLAPERCRVALSLKRLLPNPWTNAAAEFPKAPSNCHHHQCAFLWRFCAVG